MTRTVAALAAAACLAAAPPAFAANKEQQQIMAELRMLQQHQQQLQQMINLLADGLKAVTGKLDEQTVNTRKALADQRLLVEGMNDAVRVLREKSDDTNVRLASMTQELEALRETVSAMPQPAAVAPPSGDAPVDPNAPSTPSTAPAAAPPASAPPPGVSPQRTYDSAFSDYTGGQYDLAIDGFTTFLRYFPRHPLAHEAQLYIGNAHYGAGRYREAVTAYQRVVDDYPKTDSVPAAYYKMAQAYNTMKQPELARKALLIVLEQHEGAAEHPLAKQMLDRLPK